MQIKDDGGWLRGKQVAFTGRLATMTRREAAGLVASFGGEYSPSVQRQTAFLVVGQEGLPLTKRGGLTNKLRKARLLQANGNPVILPEQEFFARLGLDARSGEVRRLYSMAQLCRLLRVPRDRMRAWLRAGLIQPAETTHGVGFFDFQQVTTVKTLCDLAAAGVKPPQIRKSLEQLGRWLPGVQQPLTQLGILERDGQLLIRLDEGLAEPSGQLQLDFGEEGAAEIVNSQGPVRSADDWWETGCDAEEAGRLEHAARAYRQALYLSGPDAKLCFNLANVLYALGQRGQAVERFRQAVELDHDFAEAWNNLGNALTEMDERDEAIEAYLRALEAQPLYANARYNLADTLEDLGRHSEARPHWQAYLRLEPIGAWADYARKRLAKSADR
jgi:tetratricopeptide (TPR) repeat protein